MKIQNISASSYSPNFGAFRIEGSKKQPDSDRRNKFRSTEKFLADETIMVQRAKAETHNPKFPEPVEVILQTIKRQEKNPFDIVMYAEEAKNPEDDVVYVEVRNPQGDTLLKKRLLNFVHVYEQEPGEKKIDSQFYSVLQFAEITANLHRKKEEAKNK